MKGKTIYNWIYSFLNTDKGGFHLECLDNLSRGCKFWFTEKNRCIFVFVSNELTELVF